MAYRKYIKYVASMSLLSLIAGASPAVSEIKCTGTTAQSYQSVKTLCTCNVVTTRFIENLQKKDDFTSVLEQTSEKCPGLAAVLKPVASMSTVSARNNVVSQPSRWFGLAALFYGENASDDLTSTGFEATGSWTSRPRGENAKAAASIASADQASTGESEEASGAGTASASSNTSDSSGSNHDNGSGSNSSGGGASSGGSSSSAGNGGNNNGSKGDSSPGRSERSENGVGGSDGTGGNRGRG